MTISQAQKQIINNINEDANASNWRDWRWQIRHCVRDLNSFENLLGVELDWEQRQKFSQTLAEFPMSITPYYLSLIDTDNMENDPIFRQSFPLVAGVAA